MSESEQSREAVGVYVTDGNGRYLLTQRGPSARDEAYTWEGTGGEVEPGETAEDAARRESLEEVGIVIDNLILILDVSGIVDLKGGRWNTKIFTATTKDEPRIVDATACTGLGWFTLDEIAGLKLASYAHKDIDALQKLEAA